jgi:hypothetical protein
MMARPLENDMKKRREFVFNELFRLVCDFDEAVTASGSECDWDVDGALGAILIRLNGETRRVRKLQNAVSAEVACNGA